MRRFNTRIVKATFLMAVLLLGACKGQEEIPANKYEPINLDLKSKQLVQSSNVFGANIFKEVLRSSDPQKNALISPLSIFQALSMARNGANGETLTEMNQVLATESIDEDINIYQKKLIDALVKADNKFELNVANSIWYADDFEVLPDFINVNQNYFDAEVSALDFTKAEAAKKTINNWVNKNTKGKIPEIVDEVSVDHVMILINAIYIYGEWQNSFDAKNTKSEPFYAESGEAGEAKMMHQTSELRYGDNELFTMLEMPYGNGHFNMMILLPKEGKKVQNIINEFNDTSWSDWMNQLSTHEVNVSFPKFKFEGKYELKKPLINMGMPSAFSGAANFTGITPHDNIAISRVKHKTFIEVDEKGTEAAAVTSVEIKLTSAGPAMAEFVANKPFMFAITERDTNTILFLGKMMMPE